MNNKALEIKTGIFVSIGLTLTIISIVLLGGDRLLFTSYSNLKASFTEVQGLAEGSVVSLSGVPIGNIDKMEFEPSTNKLIVTLSIQSKFLKQITKGSTVDIRTQGALGDKYVYIKPGPRENKPLKDGDTIDPETVKGFLDVISERGNSVDKVFDIISDLNVIIAQIKDANVVGNISTSSQSLNEALKDLKTVMSDLKANTPQNQELRKSITHLANVMQKIDNGSGTLGALINDPSVHERLKSLLGTSQRDQFIKGLMSNSVKKHKSDESEASR